MDRIFLRDVKFRVQKAGRAKVLREKRKNVHAYASGYICAEIDVPNIPSRINSVTYNPYKYETFVYEDNGKPCLQSDYAELTIVKGREKNRKSRRNLGIK